MFRRKLFPNSTSPTNETVCTDYEDCYTYVEPDTIPIPPPSLPSVSNEGISPYVIIVIVVLLSIFLLISYYTFVVKFCSGWNVFRRRTPRVGSNVPDQQQQDPEYQDLDRGLVDSEIEHPIWLIRTAGLQQTIINSIAVVRYKKGEGLIEGTDCSVCLSEFQEGETLRLLPKCNHAFHIGCIDTWLRSHTNCPLCRAGIVSNPGRPSLASTTTDRSPTNSTRTEVTGSSEIGGDVAESGGGTDQYSGHQRSSSGVGDINGIGTAARDSIELIQVNRVQIKVDDLNNPNGQSSFSNIHHHYLDDDDDDVQLARRSISMEHLLANRVHSHLGNIMDHQYHGMDLYYSVRKTTAAAAAASESHHGTTTTTFINSKLAAGSSSLPQYSTPLSMKRSSSWCGRVSSAGYDRASNSKLSP